jgi:hypothetical protein
VTKRHIKKYNLDDFPEAVNEDEALELSDDEPKRTRAEIIPGEEDDDDELERPPDPDADEDLDEDDYGTFKLDPTNL